MGFFAFVKLLVDMYAILINTIIAGCALIAIIIAIRSWHEAIKTRRDMFLPIVIATSDFMYRPQAVSAIRLRNFGHGIARDVKAKLSGINQQYSKAIMDTINKYTCEFNLLDTDLFSKSLSRIEFTIEYLDVFNRRIKTKYNVTQEKQNNGTFHPHIDFKSIEIVIP